MKNALPWIAAFFLIALGLFVALAPSIALTLLASHRPAPQPPPPAQPAPIWLCGTITAGGKAETVGIQVTELLELLELHTTLPTDIVLRRQNSPCLNPLPTPWGRELP